MGKIIDLCSGSQEWLDYRRKGIGASDSAVVLGISPFKTPHQLYEDKLYGATVLMNSSMQRGLDREKEAVKWLENYFKTYLCSRLIQHAEYEWKFATVDAIDSKGQILVEIKWANAGVHALAKKGEVIDYYMAQVQSQMECCGLDKAYFLSCYQQKDCEVEFILVEVLRDKTYIDNLIFAESNFYQRCMVEMNPPDLVEKDYEHVNDNLSWDYHCSEYLRINQQIAELKKEKEVHTECILAMTRERNSRSEAFKASKFKVKGSVDTKALYESYKIDDEVLERFRKEGREQWRITKK